MEKIIISTVGISIFRNLNKCEDIFKELNNCFSDDDKINNSIIKEKALAQLNNSNDINSISAELKSINKIGVDANTKIYLFATETKDGILAADILKSYYEKKIGCFVKIEVINGLQVINSMEFERKGVKNLLEKVINIIEEYPYLDVILNPTGGFKGIVPYITIIGMIFKKEIKYIFENTENLISLPPIPVEFDFNAIKQIEEKLLKLEKEGVIEAEIFFSGIEYNSRDKYKSLILEEGNMVTLSALGEIVYKRYKQLNFIPTILVSSEAYKYINNIKDKGNIDKVKKLLYKIFNKELRDINRHPRFNETKTDCYVLKEGNTGDRVFYFLDNEIPKVCEICLSHDDYEFQLNNKGVYKKNYKTFYKIMLENTKIFKEG